MKGATCAGCRYCADGADGEGQGECRRHAPRPLMSGQLSPASGLLYDAPERDVYVTQWPSVHYAEWCGEFEPLED